MTDKGQPANNITAIINSINEQPSDEIKNQLIDLINNLINNNFTALVQLLYQIDVSENKLKEVLKQNANADAALLIADLIINRQLQKKAYRKQYNSNEKLTDEDIL